MAGHLFSGTKKLQGRATQPHLADQSVLGAGEGGIHHETEGTHVVVEAPFESSVGSSSDDGALGPFPPIPIRKFCPGPNDHLFSLDFEPHPKRHRMRKIADPFPRPQELGHL